MKTNGWGRLEISRNIQEQDLGARKREQAQGEH
jgi:hypothetical protein